MLEVTRHSFLKKIAALGAGPISPPDQSAMAGVNDVLSPDGTGVPADPPVRTGRLYRGIAIPLQVTSSEHRKSLNRVRCGA